MTVFTTYTAYTSLTTLTTCLIIIADELEPTVEPPPLHFTTSPPLHHHSTTAVIPTPQTHASLSRVEWRAQLAAEAMDSPDDRAAAAAEAMNEADALLSEACVGWIAGTAGAAECAEAVVQHFCSTGVSVSSAVSVVMDTGAGTQAAEGKEGKEGQKGKEDKDVDAMETDVTDTSTVPVMDVFAGADDTSPVRTSLHHYLGATIYQKPPMSSSRLPQAVGAGLPVCSAGAGTPVDATRRCDMGVALLHFKLGEYPYVLGRLKGYVRMVVGLDMPADREGPLYLVRAMALLSASHASMRQWVEAHAYMVRACECAEVVVRVCKAGRDAEEGMSSASSTATATATAPAPAPAPAPNEQTPAAAPVFMFGSAPPSPTSREERLLVALQGLLADLAKQVKAHAGAAKSSSSGKGKRGKKGGWNVGFLG